MADDNNQELKIHIISDADTTGFKEAAAAGNELTQGTKDLNTSVGEGFATWDKQKSVLSEAGKEAEGLGLHGREVRRSMMELNAIIPGLGHALEGMQHGLVSTAGAFVVVQLAIETAKTYWELYQTAAEQASEATAKRMDSIRESTRGAREEIENFAKAMEKASKPSDPEAEKLANDRAVLGAQFKGKRDILKSQEESDLKGATTPEQKDAIRADYAGKGKALDSQEEAQKLSLLTNTIDALNKNFTALQSKRGDLNDDLMAAVSTQGKMRKMGLDTSGADREVSTATAKLKEVDDKLVDIQGKLTRYGGEAGTASAVKGVNDFTRSAIENPTISKAVLSGGTDGGTANAEQRAANAELTKLFSQYHGGTQALLTIVKGHITRSTTQAQEIEALKNALAALQRTGSR